jgi:uncharacterized protein YodC (DUF2158 family)
MAEEIKKGDTVRLKSGGPIMTIMDIGDYGHSGTDDRALCVWFDGKNPTEKVFDLATLVRDEPPKAGVMRTVVRG